MEAKDLANRLIPVEIEKLEEGDLDFPSGKADGAIFYGASKRKIFRNGAAARLKEENKYQQRAMRYIRKAEKEYSTLPSGKKLTLGVLRPDGLLSKLVSSNPQIGKEAENEGKTLELLLTRSDEALHYNARDVLPFWRAYPVEKGVWAVIFDREVTDDAKPEKDNEN